jgi:hypothetical protein
MSGIASCLYYQVDQTCLNYHTSYALYKIFFCADEKFILSDTYIVKVLSTIDTIANTTSCIQPSVAVSMYSGCNLRSAWEVCLNVIRPAGIHCVIELPDTAYLPMNMSYGSLLLTEGNRSSENYKK